MPTFPYSSEYDPAMPMLEVFIGRRKGMDGIQLRAIVDSGADATMIPMEHLRKIGVRSSEIRWLRGIAGGRYQVSLYPVFITVGDIGVYAVVVGDPVGDEVILGRDVLNQLLLVLDGPAKSLELTR